jgi:ketosteroid isomerase-like protein
METLQKLIGGGGDDFNADRSGADYEKRLRGVFAEDIEVHEPGCLPHGGIHKGRDTWFEVRRTMMSLWDQKLDVLHIWEVPDADVIMLNYMMDWTAKETGRSFQIPAIEVLTFRDGKIAKIEFYPRDAKAMLDTLQAS